MIGNIKVEFAGSVSEAREFVETHKSFFPHRPTLGRGGGELSENGNPMLFFHWKSGKDREEIISRLQELGWEADALTVKNYGRRVGEVPRSKYPMRWFEAIGVISRNENGSLREWYHGDRHPTYQAAKKDAMTSVKQIDGLDSRDYVVEYSVIECTQKELLVVKPTIEQEKEK
jgi:hypothetical protein